MDWFKIIKEPVLLQNKKKMFADAKKEIESFNITYDTSQKYINKISQRGLE